MMRRPPLTNPEEPQLWWVGIYKQDRAFGGPEEGGWWYDCGEHCDQEVYFAVDMLPGVFRTETEAVEYAAKVQEAVKPLNVGRRSISSVLSEGQYGVMVFEDKLPDYYPEKRPHYE
jgi:hypothetical protein